MPKRQIIAMGGGSFSASMHNPVLERYVLAQTGRANPAVCFIPTATGDSPKYVRKFYRAFGRLKCRTTHLSFFTRTPDLRALILSQDVIFVGGGNTKSMLAVWRDWGLTQILEEAWRKGIVLTGVSAGAICWFDTGVTDSWAGRLETMPCLGLLKGPCCPHYDGEIERRPSVHRFVSDGTIDDVLALDDGAAAHFVGKRLKRIVAFKTKAGAYRVQRRRGQAVESVVPVTRLSKQGKLLGAGRRKKPEASPTPVTRAQATKKPEPLSLVSTS